MKKYNLYLSEQQLEQLAQLSKKRDISVSELVRRAIDNYLERELDKMLASQKGIN